MKSGRPKISFLVLAFAILMALASFGADEDAARSLRQKRTHVSARVDALEASLKEIEVRINQAEHDYKCRIAMCEQVYRDKSETLEKLATRDYGWLTNKINFLGILLSAAAILGIGIPIWGGIKMFKALHDIKKARMGTVLAGKIANKARELTETSRRNQAARDARKWHEMSKSSYRLYLSSDGKVNVLAHSWNKMPNTLSAVIECIIETRRDYMVQALISMNQAIVYNVEAGEKQSIVRNLRQLKLFYDSLSGDPDAANIANKMSHFVWEYNVSEINELLKGATNSKVDRLVLSYGQLVTKYGKTH